MDQEPSSSGDDSESEYFSMSDYSDTKTNDKSSKTASNANGKAENTPAAIRQNSSKSQGSNAETEARQRARIVQRDPKTKFVLWQPDMGDGDPHHWPEAKVLFDPLIIKRSKTSKDFWDQAPKYAYYSDRALHALLASPVPRIEYRRYVGADFNQSGDLLTTRLPRGLPALDSEGNFVQYSEFWLCGDRDNLRVDRNAYAYKVPEIHSANSSKCKAKAKVKEKGPDPIWNPSSKEAYLALHKPIPIPRVPAANIRAGSNAASAALAGFENAATDHDLSPNILLPLPVRRKRSIGTAELQQSLAEPSIKRTQDKPAAKKSGAATRQASDRHLSRLGGLPQSIPQSDPKDSNALTLQVQALKQENQRLFTQLQLFEESVNNLDRIANDMKAELEEVRRENNSLEAQLQSEQQSHQATVASHKTTEKANDKRQAKHQEQQQQEIANRDIRIQELESSAIAKQSALKNSKKNEAALTTLSSSLLRVVSAATTIDEQTTADLQAFSSDLTAAQITLEKALATGLMSDKIYKQAAAIELVETLTPANGDTTILPRILSSINTLRESRAAALQAVNELPAELKESVACLADLLPRKDTEPQS
ncbi:hypothetical protein ONS95_006219 [Cadophora gregata]|uniref:uncharacterized protein n=1 Tax=Cadophora gregata TaxID=51156 RepID=UPI0026DB9881|nr:uncharacterized protein ONS95_006219 [Cadophora gregata]KAK0102610.1 hypothetical protein ONS95_006219 [Cadophora gregata]